MSQGPAPADSRKPLVSSLRLRAYPTDRQARRASDWLYFSHKFRNEAVSFLNHRRRLRGQWLHRHPALARDGIPEELAGSDSAACSRWLTGRLAAARRAVVLHAGLVASKQHMVEAVAQAFLHLTRAERQEIPDGWLLAVPRTVFDQVLRDLERTLQRAIQARAEARKAGRPRKGWMPGFPRHRKWRHAGSIRVQVEARKNASFRDHWMAGEVFIPGLGRVKFRDRQRLPATPPSLITLSRRASGKWEVSFACALGEGKAADRHARLLAQPLPLDDATGLPACEGLDLGLASRTTDTSGKTTGRAKYLRAQRTAKALRRAQKAVCRRRKGSRRYLRAVREVARLHERVANQRQAAILAQVQEVASSNAIVCLEDLLLAVMTKNRRLAKAAYDTGLGLLTQAIVRQCEKHGHLLLRCGRFDPSSQICHGCHTRHPNLTLSTRSWTCSGCGLTHDRDTNAARNIRVMALGKAIDQLQRAPETGVRGLSSHRLKPELESFIARGGLAALRAHYRARESQPGEACTLPFTPTGPCQEQGRVG